MLKAERRLQGILKKSQQCGVTPQVLAELTIVKTICKRRSRWRVYLSAVLAAAILWGVVMVTQDSECVIEMPVDSSKLFREVVDCSMCAAVAEIDRVANITPAEFEERYASRGRPVVLSDGTRGWSAVGTFSFEFFRALYSDNGGGRPECQFFPYKTEFRSLQQALNMTRARSRLEAGTAPWYIGWSNCNDKAGKVLRRHYRRPYFLPDTSENIALSWIFMGGPGDGAHMHVDNVRYPSWQAQLRGRKKWRLAPPPECLYSCQEFQIVVEPGEIIVVDTNRWYHQTHVLPGEISITIGAEFD